MGSSYVTVTDQFCGAGGSSIGATRAGAELRLALNHWELAIETHNSNFPDADHDCTDISACDPRRYRSTDILITSPECTNHSLAKGKVRKMQAQLEMFGKLELDPTEERSRATMWDVCRFAEHHRYRYIIVENVVEARMWAPYEAWLQAMHLLGYEHRAVYVNSMHCHPTPQSRDRMYVVFWRKGHRAPKLDLRPPAWCEKCARNVEAVQSWKNPRKKWGKYRSQYVFCCPTCASVVEPYYYAAANAIDWGLPAPRIGDRARPLKEKTLKRIRIGLEKYGRRALMVDYVHTARNDRHGDMVWTADDRPHRTQLGIHTQALVTPPFTVETQWSHAEGDRSASSSDALPTQTAQQGRGLVVPPAFLVSSNYFRPNTPVDAPHPTQTSVGQHGLVVPPAMLVNFAQTGSDPSRAQPADEPWPTQTGNVHHALVTSPVVVKFRSHEDGERIDAPLSTLTAGGQNHGLLVPPAFLASYYGTDEGSPIADAVPTVTTVDRHALVTSPAFLVGLFGPQGQKVPVSIDQPTPALTATRTWALAQVGEVPDVEDCGFRMLQPHEIQAAMAFPGDYKVLGTQRERVKQLGNAVTPPVLEWIMQRVMEAMA